ncbi:MAG: hypothetical protein U1E05_16215, partial [Patescibacteria group bacterium]|nr:hypothetical protein [Patescibacteria group bacterium]
MGSPRYRFLVTFTVGSILLSATLAQVLAVGPPPIDANVAGKDIGVGYGNMTENTNVFDLVVNLVPPENQTILSSEKHDDDGDIIWNGPTKTTISDPPKREKHTWTGAGVLTNLQHQVRFHGTLGGPGPGSGVPPEFDVGVVDLDIDVNCTAAYTGDHSPPTGSLPEDKKEDEPLAGVMVEKGMIERLNPNNHTLPSMITPAQLATLHYVILRVNCQPRWHQSDSHVGDVAFTGSGLDSSYALYDIASGHKVYSLAISNTGLQKDLAIVTNNSFSAPADLTATYIWNSQKTTHQSGAEDIVRLLPLIVDLDIADLNEAQEDSPGGLVARQYQTQPVPRKAITLNSNATLGHVTLFKFTSKVKVYDAPSAGVEVTFNGTDNKFAVATLPKTLYVQGVEGSSTIGDVTLTLTHNE